MVYFPSHVNTYNLTNLLHVYILNSANSLSLFLWVITPTHPRLLDVDLWWANQQLEFATSVYSTIVHKCGHTTSCPFLNVFSPRLSLRSIYPVSLSVPWLTNLELIREHVRCENLYMSWHATRPNHASLCYFQVVNEKVRKWVMDKQ